MRQVSVNRQAGYNPWSAPPEDNFNKPVIGDLLGAAFRTENDVYAAWRWANQPDYEPDPAFDVTQTGPRSANWREHKDKLARATSQAEFDAIESRIVQETADRQTFASAGMGASLTTTMLAGLLSPTSLIPLVGPSRGAKGVAEAFALAGAAATAQEAVLYGTQETRTGAEVAMGIGAGTILGGIMGSAAVAMRGPARAALHAKAEADMMGTPQTVTHSRVNSEGEVVLDELPLYSIDDALDAAIPRRTPERASLLDTTRPYEMPKKFPVNVEDAVASNRLHALAREIDVPTFQAYDDLLTRQASYRQWISDYQRTGQLDVASTLKNMDRRIAQLQESSADVRGKGPKAQIRRAIREIEADRADLEAARTGAYSVELDKLRAALMEVDVKLRDLAPDIGKAYKQARAEADVRTLSLIHI